MRPNIVSAPCFDDILTVIGGFGRWQMITLLYCFPTTIFLTYNSILYIYLSYFQDHWCQVPELQYSNWTEVQIKNISIPVNVANEDGAAYYEKCIMYDRDYNYLATLSYDDATAAVTTHRETKKCLSWKYDTSVFTNTAVSEWNLLCDDIVLKPTIQAIYLLGVMASTFTIGPIADKFGRKTAVIISVYLAIGSSIGVTLAPNYTTFIVFRFFLGLGVMGSYFSNYVMLLECVGMNHRSTSTILFDMGLPIATLSSAILSYLVRDWRTMNLIASMVMTPVLLYPWIISESPRWLLVKNKTEEAKKILLLAAKRNKRNVSTEEINELIQRIQETHPTNTEPESSCLRSPQKLFTLWRTPEMRSRSLKIYCTWFVIAAVDYGSGYLALKLPISIFLMMTVSSVQLIVLQFGAIWVLKKFKRRLVYSFLNVWLAVGMIVFILVPTDMPWLSWTVHFILKVALINFTIIYLYTGELFPTEHRSIAISVGSFHARIGAIFATYIVDYLGIYHKSIPGIIFALFGGCAAICAFLLPETKSTSLPDTVEEVEQWRNNYGKQRKKKNKVHHRIEESEEGTKFRDQNAEEKL